MIKYKCVKKKNIRCQIKKFLKVIILKRVETNKLNKTQFMKNSALELTAANR